MTSATGFTSEEEAAVTSVPADKDIGRVVRVRWTDSGLAMHGWQDLDDVRVKTVTDVETVGLWMGENDNVVMVAGTRDADNENWLNVQLIWKPSILGTEWLS